LLEAGRIDDRLEVFDVSFETEIDTVPVRQAEAALIVSDQRVGRASNDSHGRQTGLSSRIRDAWPNAAL